MVNFEPQSRGARLTDAAMLRMAAGVQEAVASLQLDASRALALEAELDGLAESLTARVALLEVRTADDRTELAELCDAARAQLSLASVRPAELQSLLVRIERLELRVTDTERVAEEERREASSSQAALAAALAVAQLSAAEAAAQASTAQAAVDSLTRRVAQLTEVMETHSAAVLGVLAQHQASLGLPRGGSRD